MGISLDLGTRDLEEEEQEESAGQGKKTERSGGSRTQRLI
jgi:hypothetical protein